MALLTAVTIELVDTITQQPYIRVSNQETLQMPLPLTPGSAELIVAVLDRLGEDVGERARDQARQMLQGSSA